MTNLLLINNNNIFFVRVVSSFYPTPHVFKSEKIGLFVTCLFIYWKSCSHSNSVFLCVIPSNFFVIGQEICELVVSPQQLKKSSNRDKKNKQEEANSVPAHILSSTHVVVFRKFPNVKKWNIPKCCTGHTQGTFTKYTPGIFYYCILVIYRSLQRANFCIIMLLCSWRGPVVPLVRAAIGVGQARARRPAQCPRVIV